MDHDAINAILAQLPENQRDNARDRIDLALAQGWTEIKLDTPQPFWADEKDLSGTRPDGWRGLLPG